MLRGIGTTEIIVIAIVFLLLFGGKLIPKFMKGLGQGVRELKKGINEDTDDEEEKKIEE